ncbi:MAG: hypothetical protein ACK5Q5_04515 [Planctomycetaceae bacterium]
MSMGLFLMGAGVALGQTHPSPSSDANPYFATDLNVSKLTFDSALATDEERRLVQGVIDGIYPGVVQIQRGHVVISGVTRGSTGAEQPYDAELYFDAPADRVKWSVRTAHGDYAFGRNDQESFTIPNHKGGRKIATIKLRNEPPAVKFANPLDPRGLPYSDMTLLRTGKTLEEFWEFLKPFHDMEHVRRFGRLDENALELVFSIPMKPAAEGQPQRASWSRIVLDDRFGGHPVVVEEWLQASPNDDPQLNFRTTTVWKEIDAQWVPVEWRTERPGNMSARFLLDWKSVNKEIEASQFQLDLAELPKGSSVWDVRLGEKILRDRVGRKTQKLNWPPPQQSAVHISRTMLVLLNLIAFVVILMVAWHRRRRAGHAS